MLFDQAIEYVILEGHKLGRIKQTLTLNQF